MKLNPYIYKVISINKILDGDTLDLTLDLGFGLTKTDRYRLFGIDTPETFRPKNKNEYDAGIKCKDFITKIVTENLNTLLIQTSKSPDIYGRYDGTIFYQGERNLNQEILQFMIENKLQKSDILI